jgi:hypothetical protein
LYRWKIRKRNENSVGRDEEGGGRNLGEEHTLKTDISKRQAELDYFEVKKDTELLQRQFGNSTVTNFVAIILVLYSGDLERKCMQYARGGNCTHDPQ